jgi:hypothetical protein
MFQTPVCRPGLGLVISVLVLEPIAVHGLFGAIAADRHAAPSSHPPPRMVGEYHGRVIFTPET